MNNFNILYWEQYKLIEKQLIDLSEYVSIDKKNYSTFSNRLIFMYLAICSEIDSVADELCEKLGANSKERYGINNKINIILEEYENLMHWRCSTLPPYQKINIEPFVGFKENDTAEWWKDYNKVKHFRFKKEDNGIYNYELANLKNVLFSLVALYLLIIKLNCESMELSCDKFKSELFNIEHL
ncbi:hypothetical protein [Ruminococcus sp.]|uniref:hypothetical protein n=1 Tax=Ruminococcus sp. TaxID=41978 RepID=UPI0025FB3501|nr:hypothetical protein [Ruminococcus sp.]